MDIIQAKSEHSPDLGGHEDLHICVNGERLDCLLSVETGRNLRGLVPAWLCLNVEDRPPLGVSRELRERSRLDSGDQILPILMAPDDEPGPVDDIQQPGLVLVEVCPGQDTVQWKRFGLGRLGPSGDGVRYIEWLDSPGPLVFERRQYLDCLESFEKRPMASNSAGLDRSANLSLFLYRLFALFGAFFGIGSGTLALPALAYRQVQHALEESEEPPQWSFVRLMPVPGLKALGLDPAEKYLLAISRNGRELFDLEEGRRVAREAAGSHSTGPWKPRPSVEGIGPLAGQTIDLWGPGCGQAAAPLMRAARKLSNGVTALKTALEADGGRLLIVAQEDGLYIFKKIDQY